MVASSLRGRLAVWYATLLAIILAITSFLSYSFHSAYHYDEVDRSLVGTSTHVLGMLKSGDSTNASGTALPPIEEFDSPDIYVRVYSADGLIVAQSANAGHQPSGSPRQVAVSRRDTEIGGPIDWLVHPLVSLGHPALTADGVFLTIDEADSHGRVRLYAIPISNGDTTYSYLEAGVALDPLDHSMERLRLLLATMSAIGLLAAMGGGWAIAGSALRPMATMTTTARAIALSRGFSRRLPHLGRRDELGQLADTFNEMLASLEEAYQTQQRFIADASHELRAPLTTIQGNLELLERAPHMKEAERVETVAYLRQEAGRMGRLVADLLVLARADAGQPMKHQVVELDRILVDLFQETRILARGRKMALLDLDQVQLQGDPDGLKQLLLILVDNAIKYTPEGGRVQLAMRTEPGAAVVTVADTGIGIDPEDLPHLFERFYRADKARSRDLGGTGLGLSIAKWIAESHGGHISVESTVGQGSTFTLRLPLIRAPRKP